MSTLLENYFPRLNRSFRWGPHAISCSFFIALSVFWVETNYINDPRLVIKCSSIRFVDVIFFIIFYSLGFIIDVCVTEKFLCIPDSYKPSNCNISSNRALFIAVCVTCLGTVFATAKSIARFIVRKYWIKHLAFRTLCHWPATFVSLCCGYVTVSGIEMSRILTLNMINIPCSLKRRLAPLLQELAALCRNEVATGPTGLTVHWEQLHAVTPLLRCWLSSRWRNLQKNLKNWKEMS